MNINENNLIYFEEDRNNSLVGKKIAILGYGSQGRAQALNLRDSGNLVVIGNLEDSFGEKAVEDGFMVTNFQSAINGADIIFLLLPDHVHKDVYQKYIVNFIKKDAMLIVAHGYSIHYGDLKHNNKHDICLLAPRMPGAPIREKFLAGHGSPAFFAVEYDKTGGALAKLLKLADDLGFTKAGIIETSVKEETEIDLFIEQYLLPNFIGSIDHAFNYLVDEEGFNPEVTLMELYASGEVGDLLLRASQAGIHKVWEQNASPTCRFGVMNNIDRVVPKSEAIIKMQDTLRDIRSGSFKKLLDKEALIGYENLVTYDKKNNESLMYRTQKNINRIIKNAK